MDFFKANDVVGFDLEQVKKVTSIYSKSIGINCIVIDNHGKLLFNTDLSTEVCNFCSKLRVLLKNNQSCSDAHLYGSYQAERFGGKYVFFCPMGLVHWASPITKNGTMAGAILGGPVLMIEPEEFLMEDIIRKHNIDKSEIKVLKKFIDNIPVLQPDIVNSHSELLFIVAAHLSGAKLSDFSEEINFLEQQSDISEYIHYIKTMGGEEAGIENYPLDKEKELLAMIKVGDKPGSQRVLNEILGHIFFSTGGHFEIIKARVLELVVLLSRAALEGGADIEQIFGLNYKYLGEVHGFKTVEELTFWLSKIMGRFTDCVFNLADIKHVDVIYKATDFIKRNYMKKITLEEVSSHVYLSPSYFSKVFKEETKNNFNNYLNHVRVEMGKKLLLDDSLSLVDISSLVGYEDQSYFTKVFKKITGLSPGKYRESRGNIKVTPI